MAVPRFIISKRPYGNWGTTTLSGMKKLISITLLLLFSFTSYAQKDVTRFLGIPVDGSNAEMVRKLKLKGFKSDVTGQYLKGQFNGKDVNLHVVTNNNKVCRIMLCDENYQNETNIKIRFNKLVSQFVNNKRYISLDKYTLSDEEDISYEMTVNKKNYDALFYQVPNKMEIDTLALQEKVRNELLSKYTVEELIKPSEETTKEAVSTTFKIGMEMMFMKPVWFRICESYGKYSIVMYYDNEYNRSHGEDL